ncbi:phosphatase PAP2 family protein [Longibacter sp.]|uniref:phosphatase PAP2 family protein n=1 Tax=Longibacter sp. TaxID=2045415 RepID=UPI003EB936CE
MNRDRGNPPESNAMGEKPRWIRRVCRLYMHVRSLLEAAEFRLLIAIAVLAAGITGFVAVADAVVEGETRMVDERILLAFRTAGDVGDPVGGPAVEEAVRDLTAFGSVLLTSTFTLIVVGFQFLDRRPRRAAFILTSVLTGVGVIFALKIGFDRPRPNLVPHAMEALSPSFPSGHAATSAVVYLTLGALGADALSRPRLKVFAITIALLITVGVGFSRVYLGVHWPTDVLAGWTMGATWALVSWLLAHEFSQRGWIESGSRLVRRENAEETQFGNG